MHKKFLKMIIAISAILALPILVFGQTAAPVPPWNMPAYTAPDISAFRQYIDVPTQHIIVPTVIEMPLVFVPTQRSFAVLDLTTGTFEPSYFRSIATAEQTTLRVTGYGGDVVIPSGTGVPTAVMGELGKMVDGNLSTYAQFRVRTDTPPDTQPRATFTLESDRPITASAVRVSLDANVEQPSTVELIVPRTAVRPEENPYETVIAERPLMTGSSIAFPRTTSASWTFYFGHTQPLRIAEVVFVEENVPVTRSQGVRFLAQPGHSYRLYLDPDQDVRSQVGESGNLVSDKGVLMIPPSGATAVFFPNPSYRAADTDGDGVPNTADNCPSTPNFDQADIDRNGAGDLCDDFDRDGRLNIHDNCPNIPNSTQGDTDADGVGDACDPEESRFTEKHGWIPWAGMGIAALVLIGLFVMMMRTQPPAPPAEPPAVN